MGSVPAHGLEWPARVADLPFEVDDGLAARTYLLVLRDVADT